jgi:hypothetical protein
VTGVPGRVGGRGGEWAGLYAGFCPGAEAPWTVISLGDTLPLRDHRGRGDTARTANLARSKVRQGMWTRPAESPGRPLERHGNVSPRLVDTTT